MKLLRANALSHDDSVGHEMIACKTGLTRNQPVVSGYPPGSVHRWLGVR